MSFNEDENRNSAYSPEVEQPGLEQVPKHSDKQLADQCNQPVPAYIEPQQLRQRTFCGLSPLTAGLLLGLLFTLIVGAAVGGGLGASLASCHSSRSAAATSTNPTAATTPVSTGATPTPTGINLYSDFNVTNYTQVNSVSNGCLNVGASYKTRWYPQEFIPYCNRDFNNGEQAGGGGGVIADLVAIISYTFEDCLEACSTFNDQSARWGSAIVCEAISFRVDLSNVTAGNGGNCWLKNATRSNPKLLSFDSLCNSAALQS